MAQLQPPNSQQEWKARLAPIAKKNPAEVVLFSARCALRLLPWIVGQGESFRFESNQKKHAVAVYRAARLAWYNQGPAGEKASYAAFSAADMAADDAADAAAVAAVAAAAAANNAAAAAAASHAAHATDITYAAHAYAAYADLRKLENNQNGFRALPLWHGAPPKSVEEPIDAFYRVLSVHDLSDCAEEYQWFVDGNIEQLENQPWDKYERLWRSLADEPEDEPSDEQNDGDASAEMAAEVAVDQTAEASTESADTNSADTQFRAEDYPGYHPGYKIAPDDIANEDRLDRQGIAQALSSWLREKGNNGHIALGLFGDWGAGKSTFVALLKQQLGIHSVVYRRLYLWSWWKQLHDVGVPQAVIANRNASEVEFIYGEFNAWLYEHSSSTHAGIAQEAVTGLTSSLSVFGKFWLTLRYAFEEHFWRLAMVAVMLLLPLVTYLYAPTVAALAPVPKQLAAALVDHKQWLVMAEVLVLLVLLGTQYKRVLGHPLAKELGTYLRLPDFEEEMGKVPVLRRKLELLARLRLRRRWRKPARMLFVIDDLDRCSAEGVVKALEAARLVMQMENVVVLIAIDQRIALASLAQHYDKISGYMDSKPLAIARDYLGKVVHVPLILEEPSAENIDQFLEDHLWRQTNVKEPAAELPSNVANDSAPMEEGVAVTENLDEHANGEAALPVDNVSQNHQRNNDKSFLEGLVGRPRFEDNWSNQAAIRLKPADVLGLSDTQKVIFKQWVVKLRLRNPRQLKRIHNAYSLIRLRYSDQLSSQQLQGKAQRHPRLIMLLWLEYVNDLSSERRRVLLREMEQDIGLNETESTAEDPTDLEAPPGDDLWTSVKEQVADDGLEMIYLQVRNFVLPAAEPEAGLDARQKTGDQANTGV